MKKITERFSQLPDLDSRFGVVIVFTQNIVSGNFFTPNIHSGNFEHFFTQNIVSGDFQNRKGQENILS